MFLYPFIYALYYIIAVLYLVCPNAQFFKKCIILNNEIISWQALFNTFSRVDVMTNNALWQKK